MRNNLPISPKKKFKYSISFESWDEDSLEMGQTDERGFEVSETTDTIGDILYEANTTYGIYMPVSFGTWESTEPEEDRDFWEKGIRKYYALHISNEDGTEISQEESDFISFLLSDGRYEIDKFRDYAVGGIVLGAIAVGIGGLIAYYYFKNKKPKSQKAKKEKKSVKSESSQSTTKKNISSSAKSVTHIINGKKIKFPIKDAWKREHFLENKSEKYEVPQGDRKPIKYEMGGDASEHYYEVEYGKGGVARAKDVIMNKIGYNEDVADYFVSKSEKFAIWLADAVLKNDILDFKGSKEEYLKSIYASSSRIGANYGGGIREILDWLQHPVTPKQDLRKLTFDEALEKAREWHQELQVLGGDIDFTEPEKNTILKTYPKNSDGIEYYWVFIPSNYCDLESSRMGHCGRTGYGNNLISLRSVKPYGKGHTISDSHVTIAYGINDGIFYQVKGKKNNKPAEKYFPYIFDLIKGMLNNDINKLNSEKIENINSEIEKINKAIENIGNELALIDTKSIEFKAKTDAIRFLVKEERELEKSLEKIELDFNFNGFGSEYGAEEDYGFEDMSKEEIRELYDLKPSLFNDAESIYILYDSGVIDKDELEKIVERESDIFSSFGNQMKLYDLGIVSEKPSTTFELNYSCDEVYRLLDVKGFSDDIVENILCGDYDVLYNNWSYYYENPSDLVDNLNKENTERVIDEIVRITGLEKSLVTENGIEHYLNGDDEDFSKDDFDNIIRTLASAQSNADNSDYYKYLFDAIESALNELGEVKSLNYEGVKMTIDLSNSMSLEDIGEKMDYFEFTDVEDLFREVIGREIDLPNLSIDDRYSPYGSSKDFNSYVSDSDLEQGFAKDGSLREKTNKKTKINNMKPSQRKLAKGGNIETGISKEDYFLVVQNWVYFTFNYPMGFVKDAFNSKHLEEKFSSSYERYGSVGVLMNFWANLDGENRRILSLWINNNYFNGDKTKLQSISDDNYAKIITHWNMFCLNYPYSFVKKVFNNDHYELKFTRSYESAGSVGAVNKFFTELSGDNQKLLTDWVFDNYKGETFKDGGRVTTNDGIIEEFLSSERELKVGNLSTHFNKYDNQILLRNYGTLIATRKGNDVEITNTKYSKTTTIITNKVKNMALRKRMNVKYVDKFADGGETSEWKIGDKFRVLKGIYGDYNSPRYANKEFEVINIRDGKYIDARTPKGTTETFDIKNIEKIKFANGGEAGKTIRYNYDTLVGRIGDEYYFLDEIFKYNDGFKGATGTAVMPVSKAYYEYATSEDGILERYMDAMGVDEWISALGLDREDFEDEDDLIKAIEDGIYQLYYVGELNPFEEVGSDMEEQMRALPQFASSEEFPIFEIIGGGIIFDKEREFDEIYNQELFDKIKEIEEFAKGGVTYSEWLKDDYWQEQFDAWMQDGNVSKKADGTYSTQDAQYRNSLKGMSELKKYFYNEFIKGQNSSYFADGGKAGKKSIKKPIRKKPQPKMVRQYFEDRPYSYAGGGNVKGIKKKAEKLLEESISYRWANTDMGSGWSFKLESPLNRSVFNVLEQHTYLDEFSPEDAGFEDWDDLSDEDKEYYYEEWKEEFYQGAFEKFKEKCMKHLDDFIEYIQQAKEYQDEINEYADGGEVQEWMDEALESLIEETDYEDLEITIVSDSGNEFIASDGNIEYRVFVTEDVAEEKAVEEVYEDMEESPENFNKDFIANYIDGRGFFESALDEMNRGYAEDIKSESDDIYANRLVREMVEYGLLDKDDALSDDGEELAEESIDDFVNLMTEEQLNDGNDGLDYFIDNFGEEYTMKLVIDNNLIDVDRASQDAVDTDGIAYFLSSYDGETLYLYNDCVAYRTN